MKGLIGKKVGMTQLIGNDGKVTPVTLIEAGPCFVTQVRTLEREGYEAVQLTLGKKKREFKNRPNQKVDVAALKLDDTIGVDSFAEGDKVRALKSVRNDGSLLGKKITGHTVTELGEEWKQALEQKFGTQTPTTPAAN